jgi:hypothetical protein
VAGQCRGVCGNQSTQRALGWLGELLSSARPCSGPALLKHRPDHRSVERNVGVARDAAREGCEMRQRSRLPRERLSSCCMTPSRNPPPATCRSSGAQAPACCPGVASKSLQHDGRQRPRERGPSPATDVLRPGPSSMPEPLHACQPRRGQDVASLPISSGPTSTSATSYRGTFPSSFWPADARA